jgi:thiol-disulfide isomerase/thioredoxin
MRVDKGTVRAPEIARIWFNSPPLALYQQRGKVVLIDFWDYTCVNCIRTLPYIQAWHERYKESGLTVIGVHTPEFTFATYESNVQRGIAEFGLTYPIVVDSNYDLWRAYANRYWPSKYLLDGDGYLRWAHFGEGSYRETEEMIQELLREVNPELQLPALMNEIRESDKPGAVCFPPSPELYLGHRRGRIGNDGGFKEDATATYTITEAPRESFFYAEGEWNSTVEFFAAEGEGDHRIVLKYSGAGVNCVMGSTEAAADIIIHQDGEPLPESMASREIKFRERNGQRESYMTVKQPRMYSIIDSKQFGAHTLELGIRTRGLALWAFTFTSCIDPELSHLEDKSTAGARA